MPARKLLPLFLVLPLFGLSLFFWPKPHPSPRILPYTFPVPTLPPPNPYLISSLQNRTYDSSIRVENEIRRTSRFISSKISFYSDNLLQYALMNVPVGIPPEDGWPVVFVNHGYIDPVIYSTEKSYINTSAFFASSGFLVIKPDYRGHAGSEGDSGSLTSRISYAIDVLNLLYGVKKLNNINPSRIYMYGHSMGGDVTLRVAEICPDCLKAISLWAPAVSDWPESYFYFSRRNLDDPIRRERYEKMQAELQLLFSPQEYPSISTMANVSLLQIPVNLHHGTLDESVPFEWSQRLSDRLQKSGIKYEFYSYYQDNHDISRHWSEALNRDIQLFNNIK